MTNRKITYIEESGDLEAEIMTGQQLMDATTTVVRTIARDHGTDVVFAGSGAATDGRKVLLPSIPTDAKITRRQALVTGGFANHESLHKLLTDFNATGKIMKKWHEAGKKLTRSMANAIEDIRIEAGGQVLYNGLPKSIDKTAREVNREFIDKIYPHDPSIVNDFRKIGPVAVTWEGRRRLGYPDPSMAEAMALLPEDVRKRVNKIVDQVMKLEHGVEGMGRVNQVVAYKGSLEAYKLAERIVRAYEKEKEDERAKLLAQAQGNGDGTQQGKVDPKSEAKSGSESPAGESSSDGKGTTEAKSGGDESKPDQETGDAPTKSEGEVTKDADHGRDAEVATDKQGDGVVGGGVGATVNVETGDEEEPEPVSAELGRIVQTVLGEILQSDGGYRVLNASEDETIKPKVHPHDRLTYQAIKSGMGPELGTVRRKLERVLVAMKENGWENGKRSGRLNVRRNARKIIELRPDVFKKRVEESTVNAAMSVLVDLSGSMTSEGKLHLATQATIAVVEALDGTGIPIEVSGHYTFISGLTRQVWEDMDEDMKRAVSRAQSIRNIVFKGFDDPLSRCRDGIGGMSRMSSGANADGDAILMAAKRLLDRREDRKVMLVLSDGQPAYSAYNRDIHKHTRDCVQWCVEQGIEIVGLGIKSNAVERYYPRHVVVHSMEGFAKTYIDEVAKLLTGRAVSNTGQLIASGVRRGTRL